MIEISQITDLRNVHFVRYRSYVASVYVHQPEFKEISPGRWIDIPVSKEISYGDLHSDVPAKNVKMVLNDEPGTDLFMIIDHCTGSDYAGTTVELSNYRTFLKNYGEYPGVYDVYGGYDTRAIAVSVRWMLNPDNEDIAESIIDTISALSDYPLIDDEDLSNLESDLEHEYITTDWYKWELPREFKEQHGIEIIAEDCNTDQIWDLYRVLSERANEYPIFETNGWPYIRTEEIVRSYKVGDLTALDIPHALVEE